MILAIVVLGGMGSQIGVAIAAVVMIGGTEILRELDWLKALRRRLRPDAVPHAAVRARHGRRHGLAPARAHRHAHALDLPQGAAGDLGALVREGHG